MVGSSGLEPPTSRLSGGCSNQLSYKPIFCVVLFPLNQWFPTLVEMMGFGLGANCAPRSSAALTTRLCCYSLPLPFSSHILKKHIQRKTKVLHCIYFGGDDGIRTHDPLLAGQVLSQLSYTPIGLLVSSKSPLQRTSMCWH